MAGKQVSVAGPSFQGEVMDHEQQDNVSPSLAILKDEKGLEYISREDQLKWRNYLYRAIGGDIYKDQLFIDINLAFFEELLVSIISKITSAMELRQFDERFAMKIDGRKETILGIPYRIYLNGEIIVKLIDRAYIARMILNCKEVGITRRIFQGLFTTVIIRVSRRQDIFYHKNPKLNMGNFRFDVKPQLACLFHGLQTYPRFRSMIQNHCGIGVPLQMWLNSSTAYSTNARERVLKRTSTEIQKDYISYMSTMMLSNSLTKEHINLLLESYLIFYPKMENQYCGWPFLDAKNSQETWDGTKEAYESATVRTVKIGEVPYAFVEYLTMAGVTFDSSAIHEYMFGKAYYRKDIDFSKIVLTEYQESFINYLAPLKGSATGTEASARQENTMPMVHGRRTLEDNYDWMASKSSAVTSGFGLVTVPQRLQQEMQSKITESGGKIEVCSFDTNILNLKGDKTKFWNTG